MVVYIRDKHLRGLITTCLAIFLLFSVCPAAAAEWQSQSMIQPRNGAMPLMPFLDYYIDETLSMDIEEASSPVLAGSYRPLSLDSLPRVEGITWLRFTIAPLPPDARPATYLLDMGQSIPGVPVLYDAVRNELSSAFEWRENTPAQRNILLLPEESQQAMTCYIRIDGLPGPWFSPMIRTPQNAASNLGSLSRTAAVLALGVVMLLCLLRGLSENGQWRIWTALYVAFALAQAILGMPPTSEKFSIATLAAILTPGIALMLLPHVGRHLMRTPQRSRALDIQLLLLSLPGAALALLPLVPGWAWLERWLDLWPAVTLIFVPTALGAWIMGIGGAKRFLAGCLIPPLFVAVAIVGLDFGLPPNLLASAPIWGVALSALLIAATRAPYDQKETDEGKKKKTENKKTPKIELPGDPVISLEHPLDDPNLRLVQPMEETADNSALESMDVAKAAETSMPGDSPLSSNRLEERENALRAPLDDLLRQGAALGQCSLPPAVRQYAENMLSAAGEMAEIIAGHNPGHQAADSTTPARGVNEVFSLQRILRDVHDSVSSFAESSGTSLSWYLPPNLGRLFYGNPDELEAALRILLESSVRASRNGSVHISARKVPESDYPGHILFSITDNGKGTPPRDRSSLAISKAWEMIGRHGGYLAMEAGPDGVAIALSMRFAIHDDEENRPVSRRHVILACEDPAKRRELAKILDGLPCRITEVASSHEALVCQGADPAPLLIAYGRLAQPAAADMVHQFTDLAHDGGYDQCFVLAITHDNNQWNLLKPSGFTHAMLEPDNPGVLRNTIADLLDQLGKLPATPEPVFTAPEPASDNVHEDMDLEETIQDAVPSFSSADLTQTPVKASKDGGPDGMKTCPPDENGITTPQFTSIAFEGPDWLEAEPDDADSVPDGGNSPTPAKKTLSQANSGQHELETAHKEDEPFEEFVGEPTPVGSHVAPAAEKPAAASGSVVENHAVSSEKTGNLQAETLETEAPAHTDSLMEFIVGVEKTGTDTDTPNSGQTSLAEEVLPNTAGQAKVAEKTSEFVLSPAVEEDDNSDPLVANLTRDLDSAMNDATAAFSRKDIAGVADATARIATTADEVGLRILCKMAQCVERAAQADDLTAVSDLLPELSLAVERTRIALRQARQ